MHHWPSERLLFVHLALTTANRGLTSDAIGGAYYGTATLQEHYCTSEHEQRHRKTRRDVDRSPLSVC